MTIQELLSQVSGELPEGILCKWWARHQSLLRTRAIDATEVEVNLQLGKYCLCKMRSYTGEYSEQEAEQAMLAEIIIELLTQLAKGNLSRLDFISSAEQSN